MPISNSQGLTQVLSREKGKKNNSPHFKLRYLTMCYKLEVVRSAPTDCNSSLQLQLLTEFQLEIYKNVWVDI